MTCHGRVTWSIYLCFRVVVPCGKSLLLWNNLNDFTQCCWKLDHINEFSAFMFRFRRFGPASQMTRGCIYSVGRRRYT
jgi:hypothetical protein